ncbi:MAG: hypothetical protein M3336_11390, partial [Chloroflexota bacterium]|nr:hypothetical protein [Chloroflexota bacterium]
MRAVVLSGPNEFALRDDVPKPRPAASPVLLRVASTTMCGTDQKILAGQFPGTPLRWRRRWLGRSARR